MEDRGLVSTASLRLVREHRAYSSSGSDDEALASPEFDDRRYSDDGGAGGDDDGDGDDADINLLKKKLEDLPQSLQQEGFNALKEILDFLDTEDLQPSGGRRGDGGSSDSDQSGSDLDDDGFRPESIEDRLETLCNYIDEDWETVIDNHFTGFNHCIKSFSSVIKPKVGDTLEQLKLLSQKLDKAKLYAGSRTTDLKDKHLKRIQHTEMLRILDCVEELTGVVPQLDGMLGRGAFLDYVRRLNWALKMIMGEDMANIGALAELREQLLERKNAIHQILLDQLQNLIFVRQVDEPQVGPGGGADYSMRLTRREVLPRLAPSTVAEQYHSVRRQLSSTAGVSTERSADRNSATPHSWTAPSGARAGREDALLEELTQALQESLVAPLDVSYERVVRSLKIEIKRMLDEAAEIVGAMERERREHDAASKTHGMAGAGAKRQGGESDGGAWEALRDDGLHRPSSRGLVDLMELAHQMYVVVFFNLVRFSCHCEQATAAVDPAAAREMRMYALAETWRDMQNTIELFVLKHLREPMSAGEGTYTTQELFSGSFSTKLTFSFGSVNTHAAGVGVDDNEDYAGSEFVQCSPYHMMAIYSPLQAFAEVGLSLLTATGMDPLLARGSHLLPTFVDDFVTHTFLSQLVEDSNRLCFVAVQATDAFAPPSTPSRVWRRSRAPLQSCLVVTKLIETLYACMRAIPAHADLFLNQVTSLITRYATECRRQIDLGGRDALAYKIVCPTQEAASASASASAAALGSILQSQSNRAWKLVLREREQLSKGPRTVSNGADDVGAAFSDSEAASGALFRSEFAALSAALHEHEEKHRGQKRGVAVPSALDGLMSEGQCTLLANVVDALAFLCERVGELEDSFLRSGALVPEAMLQEGDAEGGPSESEETASAELPERDEMAKTPTRSLAGRSIAGRTVTSYSSMAQKTLLSALRSGAELVGAESLVGGGSDSDADSLASDLDDMGVFDDEGSPVSGAGGAVGRRGALARCWALHDRSLLVLRTELRCQCFLLLRRTRDVSYEVDSLPVNPEEFVVAWNRALEQLNALIKTYLPAAKHTFVMSGLPSTMAAILEHHSGVLDQTAVNANGVMQMRRNVFALQNVVKTMHVGNAALQAEDVFLDQLMRRLVALYDQLASASAAAAASPPAAAPRAQLAPIGQLPKVRMVPENESRVRSAAASAVSVVARPAALTKGLASGAHAARDKLFGGEV